MLSTYARKCALIAAAFLTLCTGTASAAADAERQLDTIANADEAWNEVLEHLADADSRYMRFAVHDSPTLDIAVTDLDDNGRLEVIFRTSRVSTEIVADADMMKKPDAYIRSMENVASVPLGVYAFIYQVTEDGTRLEPVKIDLLNGDRTADFPDLMQLKEPHEISADMMGARLYRIHTKVRGNPAEYGASLVPFRLLYHTVRLTGNTLYCRLDAKEEGNYSVYEDGGIESFVRTVHMDGREVSREEFGQSSFLREFRTYPPVRGSIKWVSGAHFRDEDFRSTVRTLLASSWQGFSYGIR
ncbi:hypothetical protein TAMA11512_16880 [Selenomonas sp. TAMA-11512]|uniref:hypothetical protein n=1 Tax=Selenomonas sp. TAMA-11512 TaxID=3095337 RepID=UPI00308E2D9C|nr:hypothetical protein TAMA11512_16880 [Selenomonas sp. TAMA-11512]